MRTSSPHVVVGVDGSAGSSRAIEYGVHEARRDTASLRLVHVAPIFVPLSPMLPLAPEDVAATGRAILGQAMREATELAPDLTIETELRRGSRSAELTKASADASVLAVGRDTHSLVERAMWGNTVTAVASRAACPVVSVPPAWESSRTHGVIVVGLKSTTQGVDLLDDAFASAESTGARVIVLHAWKLASGYDDIITSRGAISEWNERSSAEIDSLLLDWRDAYPLVEAQVEVVHEYAARALIDASQSADLVVLARRKHGIPASLHLGGTARAALRAAACPVRVIPPGVRNVLRGLDMELSGTIEK